MVNVILESPDMDNEWPYPDNGPSSASDAEMQRLWNENQAAWRTFLATPTHVEWLLDWLEEDYLLDGVPIPEWAQGQTPSIPWYERGGIP